MGIGARQDEGILNVAPVLYGSTTLSDSVGFATAGSWANLRTAALYGGGIALNLPPASALANSTYLSNVERQITWANQNGLRSSVIISPGGVGYDPLLLEHTKALVAALKAAGAMPSQFIVENYSGVPLSAGNYISTDQTNTESLNSVALYLSGIALTPTASEAGLEISGSNATSSVTQIMTGIAPSMTVGLAGVNPYAQAQVFSANPADVLTATVTVNSTYLTLTDAAGGTLNSDGSMLSISGTGIQIQTILQSLSLSISDHAPSTEHITVSLNNSHGIATSITTELALDPNVLHLTAESISTLTPMQFLTLSETSIAALTVDQIVGLSNSQMQVFSPEQMDALSPHQLGELALHEFESFTVPSLTDATIDHLSKLSYGIMVAALAPSDISSLVLDVKSYLNSHQVQQLSSLIGDH